MTPRWIIGALLLGILGTSCGRVFDPYWRIVDFRVLALRTSEPELRPGETAIIDALTFSPDGDPIEYQWEWCPFRTQPSQSFECPFTKDELDQLFREQANLPDGFSLPIPDFDLGTNPTAELAYPATPALIRGFCESLQSALEDLPPQIAATVPVVDCKRGLDVSLRLTARSGGKEIIAGKRMNLWTQAELENNNPQIDRIQIRPKSASDAAFLKNVGIDWVLEPIADQEAWWVDLPEDTLPIYAGVGYELRVLVDPASIDIWTPPAPQGADREFLDPVKEVIIYRWLTTLGDISNSEKLFKEELNTLEAASLTELDIAGCPDNKSTCEVKIWAITRDGRLGVDWLERDLSIVGGR